jgi:GNAT superfamily N-acetyltransferase
MQLIEVNSPETVKAFIRLPLDLYKNDPNFIRPLDKDIEEVFSPKKNKLLRNGACIRWILKDSQGQVIGRLAAFVNPQTAKTFDQPTGGIGFFECINDRQAAFRLFDAAQQWLREKGMEAMDGPINLGDRDKWWGLLVEEFSPATYGTNYNFPYYRDLFEAYGFQVYFKQFTYKRQVTDPLEGRYAKRAEEALSNPDYSFRHLEKSKMNQYAEDFRIVYNKAWVKHQGVKEMSAAQAQSIMKKMKPVMDEKLLWFAYYQDEPVGFFIAIPELNQLFRYVNGKLDLWGKIKFVFHKWRGAVNRATGIAFGIAPEHQRKGVEAAMILAAGSQVYFGGKTPYQDIVMNWIGDFNPKMMRVCEQIGSKIYKTHHTYRKLFDETKEFKRAPMI